MDIKVNRLTKFILLFFLLSSFCLANDGSSLSFIQIAKNLPNYGELRINKGGYLYVSVSNRYIDELYPLIPSKGFNVPNHYLRPNTIGAHISVMYEFETKRLPRIKEIGQKVYFDLENIKIVENNKKKFFVIQLTSKDLENIRKKYSLKPMLAGHKFHITIAEKWKFKK